MRRASKTGGVYLRILLCFLSFLIPIAAIGFMSYFRAASQTRKESIARIEANLESSSNMIELAIKMAEATCFGFFNDDGIRLSLRPNGSQPASVLAERWRIPRVLQRSENAIGEYADRLFAFVDFDDVWVSGGLNSFQFFFERVYRYESYNADFFKAALMSGKEVSVLPVSEIEGLDTAGRERVVPVVMRGRVEDLPAVLVLNISAAAMERTLRGGAVFPSTVFLVLSPKGGNILPRDPVIGSWKPDSALLRPGFDSYALIEGARYLVSNRTSSPSGWTYVALTPLSSLEKLEMAILRMTLLTCSILAGMSLAFAFVFSSSIYSPIRAIRDTILSLEQAKPSEGAKTRDDFAAIRIGLDHLKVSGERSRALADEWTREYVENAFRFMLRGHVLGRGEILREALEEEYCFEGKGYACAAVSISFSSDWYADFQDTERLAIAEKARDIILAMVAETTRIVSLEFSRDRLACIADLLGPESVAGFFASLSKAIESFEYDEGRFDLTVGLGGYREGLDELSASWDEAMTSLARRDPKRRFQVIVSPGTVLRARALFTPLDEQELLNALKEGDPCRIGKIVDGIFALNQGRGVPWSGLRSLHDDLVSCGNRFLAERGLPLDTDRKGPMPIRESGKFDDASLDPGELTEDARSRLILIAALGFLPPGNRRTGLVASISEYVETHFDRGLCLERIADELGVSSKYVSKVFKEATGENLTDRIDRVRMSKAKELLLSTDMRVSDISAQVGIDSRATFLRVFHKTEGMTPTAYREKYGGKAHKGAYGA